MPPWLPDPAGALSRHRPRSGRIQENLLPRLDTARSGPNGATLTAAAWFALCARRENESAVAEGGGDFDGAAEGFDVGLQGGQARAIKVAGLECGDGRLRE